VLPSGDETLTVLKQLGWTPARSVQQELPGMPTQGELPLNEFDASGYDRYSIYMDDYDLEEKFPILTMRSKP
jgi:hypothetical protein